MGDYMEVLSIGEKIKRARIYKGYTLKDVCDNKISVSKLSCIENDKVVPESWILEYISSKLNLDIEYINEDVETQINKNIKQILKDNDSEDYAKKLKYNLIIADKYGHYELAVNIMHLIFRYFIDKNNLKEAQELIGSYYDISNKSNKNSCKHNYYMDIATLFYKNNEFYQASIYFRNIRKYASYGKDNKVIAYSIYGEIKCYIKMQYFHDAYKLADKLQLLLEYISDDLRRAQIYQTLAILSLKENDGKFNKYEKNAYELYKDHKDYIARAMFDFASTMFSIGESNRAVDYIKKSMKVYPYKDKENLVKFMLKCTEEFIKNNVLEESNSLIDTILNYAIKLNNIKFIEKSYYLKAMLLKQQNNLISAEMYMNLSLDALVKFGNKKDIYDRYMIMGEMYYKIGSIKESLKYFTLAMSLQKKL
ncbi:helix-turn-helix domain-containing protein [Clostridium botulinum C]|uniref:Transcriptional regulator n=3 Tax=Clostridiaceae TaxID=31979 RepID=A0A9Q4XVP7_CLOBO|nr:helix-turn-helix transcriptional regulator [Clostridium botulinum]MCD3193748.1 helix-turn-helix domain-containing protein [Clostridium botulinum C]MCD3199816.1 helix-turn-helix domain-containing protein [Clostridium botulinum C]MCD3205291.1 helix-turn-helix domain-containing protein [Clostridium botulinum C]MCD3207217.1 helix-turn-helix domain-containing protein [Clostridium botulinum C]MCD3224619.1 helix-turn-helix domain-containing protein [Clostridium botulinum C]